MLPSLICTVLHNGVPVATMDLRIRKDHGSGLLTPIEPIAPVMSEVLRACATINNPPDLPKWRGGMDDATSQAAREASARIAQIGASLSLQDSLGRPLPGARITIVEPVLTSQILAFVDFDKEGAAMLARLQAPRDGGAERNPPPI